MISLNWIKDYIDISDQKPEELAVKITQAGVNVEKVVSLGFKNLVIGYVKECVPHKDSDHLHVCQVDIGNAVTQIVCGASNIRAGLKVLVALPGCVLPGDFEIKAGKIRGEVSNGMICALFELGLEKKTEETYNAGIAELDTDLAPGTDANIYLGTDDTLLELDVHKHKNNDCYYHIGLAYEIGSILNRKVNLPKCNFQEIDDDVKNHISVKVDTDKCPYYLGKMVKDVKIKESPEFIKKRLIAAGMRSINNVVDISNFVMLEYGQPLHFFDKKKVGDKIVVRNALDKEEIITLDGNKRTLKTSDIVITDGKKPICLAGVMGGENTEVDENTTEIFIESAIFDSVSIRNTAARLDLKSEASIRYGKGLNFEYTQAAIERACNLLEKYAGAKVLKGVIKHDNLKKKVKKITFKTEEICNLVGLKLTDDDVKVELNRLGFDYLFEKGEFIVTIPNRRLDIEENVNDIAEEIARLYGYHNLKSTLPDVETKRGCYAPDVKLRKEISKRLRSLGLNETRTYTLVSDEMAKQFRYEDKKQIKLPNPMLADKSVLRTTLIPSIINIYEYNKARGIKNIMLYEIAKTYDVDYKEDVKVAMFVKGDYIINEWQGVNVKADFYCLKGIVENLLNYLGYKNRYSFVKAQLPDMHPGITAKIILDKDEIGLIGRVHPSYKKDEIYVAEFSMTKLLNKQIKPLKFKEANKYPEIVKDVAFLIDEDMESETVRNQIKRAGGKLLSDVKEFDIYNNVSEGKKSVAYSLTFKDENKTLLDEEVMQVFNRIINEVEQKLGCKLRQ